MSEKQKTVAALAEKIAILSEKLGVKEPKLEIRTKKEAREFLWRAGIVTKSGKLTAPYRSSK